MTTWSPWCAGPAAALATFPSPPETPAPRPTARTIPVHDVSDADGCLKTGRAAAARGDLVAALEWFDRATTLEPQIAVGHFCRALCLVDMDREEEAAWALDSALHLQGGGRATRVQLARVYASNGHGKLALQMLAPILLDAPDLVETVRKDESFAGLRDHPHFLQLIGEL